MRWWWWCRRASSEVRHGIADGGGVRERATAHSSAACQVDQAAFQSHVLWRRSLSYSATQLYVDPGAELVPAYTPYSTGGVAGELPPPVYTPYSTGVVYEPRPGNLLEYDVGYERPYSSSYSYY